MPAQAVFQPAGLVGADGWVEQGGGTQPPNRALPAPIFDAGTQYQPNNGAVGTWIIAKTINSPNAGAGSLEISPGAFPTAGGIFADDNITVRLNGVVVPFTGTGTGVLAVQTRAVTWLSGANLLEFVIGNTIAGGTAVAGRMVALLPGVPAPCDCCPIDAQGCATVVTPFDQVAITATAPGWTNGPLTCTLSGHGGGEICGFNSPGGPAVDPTPVVEYTFSTPQNRVTGVRLWNQGGGDLSDFDGLSPATVLTVLNSAAVVLFSGTLNAGNGGAPFDTVFPSELNGVKTVRFSQLRKLSNTSVAPLWQEFAALEVQSVYACRRPSGALEWHDEAGNVIPAASVVPCVPEAPLLVSNLTMTEAALGDDPGLGERMCNVVPAPSSFTGYSLQPGPCYDGSAGADSLTWAGSLSSLTMSYESGGNPNAGAALVAFSAPSIGTVTWPVNGVKMLPGEVRRSNPLVGGGHATLTYLAPAGAPANGAPSLDGGPNIRLGPAVVQAFTSYSFRIDFWAP